MAVIKDYQIVGCTLSGNLFTDHMVLYYMKRLCHALSSIYHITGRRRKGEGLELLCKYNYYYGKAQRLFLLLCCFPRPLNETRHLYWNGCSLRQYGNYLVSNYIISLLQTYDTKCVFHRHWQNNICK